MLTPSRGAYGREGMTTAGRDVFNTLSPQLSQDLTTAYGSPLYVMLEDVVRDSYRRLSGALRDSGLRAQVAFSVKTNFLTSVCKVFEEEGAVAEIVSGFEYEVAQRAGFPDSRIVFNGPFKSAVELARLAGRIRINAETMGELDELDSIGRRTDVIVPAGLRISLPIGEVPWSRFGFNLASGEAREAIEHVARLANVSLAGLHCHIGTNITRLEAYEAATRMMCELALALRESGVALDYIDLGGGLAAPRSRLLTIPEESWDVPSLEAWAATVAAAFGAYFRGNDAPLLMLEPGRSLVSEAGIVLVTVVSTKRAGDRLAVTTDGGINIVPSTGIKHELRNLTSPEAPMEPVDVFGPLCMQVDCISNETLLPEPQVGDVIGVFDTGAYDFAHSLQFIRLRPAVVMLDGSLDARLIRRAESPEDLFALDSED